jgi:hypothetical protein
MVVVVEVEHGGGGWGCLYTSRNRWADLRPVLSSSRHAGSIQTTPASQVLLPAKKFFFDDPRNFEGGLRIFLSLQELFLLPPPLNKVYD